LVAGIDEAGRGPVIGPMVMACVVVDERSLAFLERLGVRDSKALSPAARSRLSRSIARIAVEVRLRVVSPEEIDSAVWGVTARNLNDLEARVVAELIDGLKSEVSVVYLDSPDPNPARYAGVVRGYLRVKDVEIVADNKAEEKYVIVATASILAKVKRDAIIKELEATYGPLGSGYPSDPRTREFLVNWVREHGSLPPIARKSWETSKKILSSFRRSQ